MNDDLHFLSTIESIRSAIQRWCDGVNDSEEIASVDAQLSYILRYAHQKSAERPVQLDQIESNIGYLRNVIFGEPGSASFTLASSYLDNLVRYCGVQI